MHTVEFMDQCVGRFLKAKSWVEKGSKPVPVALAAVLVGLVQSVQRRRIKYEICPVKLLAARSG